jgi:hypothetical protein
MIKLTRSSWGGGNSVVIADGNDVIVKIYPNSLNTNTLGAVNGTRYGAISPAFRDSDGTPQGLSFSVAGDYYEVYFADVRISGNEIGTTFAEASVALDTFFTSQN